MAEYELTISILQGDDPIFDKPKLQEKYMTKPPFRFLHDVITAVQRSTDFAPGLYEGDELDAKAITDKESKVAYLAKIINVVSMVLGEAVPAKPLKIVAGLEPENTNVFLQMLGKACRMNNGAAAVQQVLAGGGGAPPPPEPQGGDEPPAEPKKKERKPKAPEPEAEEDAPPPKSKSKSKSKPAPDDGADQPPVRSASPANEDAMNSSQGARVLSRPQSARKAPPPLPSQTLQSSVVAGVRTSGAGAGRRAPGNPQGGAAQGGANRPIALFEEGADMGSDDDVEVVHEARPVALGPRSSDIGEKGVLVKDILEAEEDLKKAGAEAAVEEEEESGGQGIILKRKGSMARGAAGAAGAGGGAPVRTNDLASIRELVQKLCQSSNPLAKSMDYLAEDIENMSKEYRFWQTERRVFQDRLNDEQRMQGNTEKYDAQIADLDSQIKQARDRIVGVKGSILRNEDTINNLLGMAVGK